MTPYFITYHDLTKISKLWSFCCLLFADVVVAVATSVIVVVAMLFTNYGIFAGQLNFFLFYDKDLIEFIVTNL